MMTIDHNKTAEKQCWSDYQRIKTAFCDIVDFSEREVKNDGKVLKLFIIYSIKYQHAMPVELTFVFDENDDFIRADLEDTDDLDDSYFGEDFLVNKYKYKENNNEKNDE